MRSLAIISIVNNTSLVNTSEHKNWTGGEVVNYASSITVENLRIYRSEFVWMEGNIISVKERLSVSGSGREWEWDPVESECE